MSVSKRILCIFISCLLVCLPLIQRSNAVVGVDDVAITIILTLLLAMGITLVVADMKTDQYIASRTAEFLQSIGAGAQSFGQWLVGSDSGLIALKNGFLSLPETIVTKGKQFINWLVPNASSNTVINLNDGNIIANPILNVTTDSIDFSTNNYNAQKFVVDINSRVFVSSYGSYPITITDVNNQVRVVSQNSIYWEGYYDLNDEFVNSPNHFTGVSSYDLLLVLVTSASLINNTVSGRVHTVYPGVYVSSNQFSSAKVAQLQTINTGNDIIPRKILSVDNDLVIGTPIDASAIIGSYDDLSALEDSEIESAGTTFINNTFYITQDGQALNPDSQSLDDVIGALQDAIDSINQKIDVIGWTEADTAEGTLTPDYSDFELGNLNFTQLGALITTRFPFSIPWDLVRIFQLFVADPQPPSWTFDILPADNFANIDTEITLDLSQYPIIGTISRWFCVIDLCLGLVFASKKLIWTA